MDNKMVHKELLEILKVIDLICEKENLSYMIQSGTLLGAVRENGFIEWDDDADIMMHRRDFDKFESISHKHLRNTEFYFDYSDRVPKVCRKDNPKIHVDIFIIDALPNNVFMWKLKVIGLKLLQGMMKKDIDYKNYNLKGKVLVFITSLMGCLMSDRLKLKLYKKLSKLGNNEKSNWVFISNELYRFMNFRIQKSLLEETIRLRFADTELIAPMEWDYFLKLYYGDDYMTPKRENYFI